MHPALRWNMLVRPSEENQENARGNPSRVSESNRRLKEYADEHQQMTGMGTTIVAAVIDQDTLIVANVGDSRLNIHRRYESNRSRKDHSLVQEMVRLGKMTDDEKVPEITRIRTS